MKANVWIGKRLDCRSSRAVRASNVSPIQVVPFSVQRGSVRLIPQLHPHLDRLLLEFNHRHQADGKLETTCTNFHSSSPISSHLR
jgi:hypothetical protein